MKFKKIFLSFLICSTLALSSCGNNNAETTTETDQNENNPVSSENSNETTVENEEVPTENETEIETATETKEETKTTEEPIDEKEVASSQGVIVGVASIMPEPISLNPNEIHTRTYEYETLEEDAVQYSRQIFALDTIITLVIYSSDNNGEDLLDIAEETIFGYETALSKTIEGSFTYELNKNKSYDLTNHPYRDNIIYLLNKSLYYNELSNGYFDITIEPLVNIWNFGEDNQGEIPSDDDINEALSKIDSSNIVIDGYNVSLLNGATIDFGGIAKGYIADKTSEALRLNGCASGIINLGGNVLTVGVKPTGTLWKVGIKNPDETVTGHDDIITAGAKSIVTSGIYERKFEKDGKTYHHILDYTTGYPSESDVLYSNIICDYSIDGDALATILVLLGSEEGINLINSLDNVDAMIVTKDGNSFFSTDYVEKYNFIDK
ncbi:MAG: FAD:protein FMN transferase [Lachnospirales bacterium]